LRSGTAARACTVAQGAPSPSWLNARVPLPSGQSKRTVPPFGVSQAPQRTEEDFGPNAAVVCPDTSAFSKAVENFSKASVPQAFAVVVSQCPCFMRPRAPLAMRGASSFHVSRSVTASSARTALTSGETMSHHRRSALSVENPIAVPCRLIRERRTCCAAASFFARSGMSAVRFSTPIQSITAEVGHRLGSTATEASRAALAFP